MNLTRAMCIAAYAALSAPEPASAQTAEPVQTQNNPSPFDMNNSFILDYSGDNTLTACLRDGSIAKFPLKLEFAPLNGTDPSKVPGMQAKAHELLQQAWSEYIATKETGDSFGYDITKFPHPLIALFRKKILDDPTEAGQLLAAGGYGGIPTDELVRVFEDSPACLDSGDDKPAGAPPAGGAPRHEGAPGEGAPAEDLPISSLRPLGRRLILG